MRVKQVYLYEYHELSDSAKEKAREWYREASCNDSSWSEFVIDEAKEQGQFLGFDEIEKIYWTGFWSQGDGACIEGTWRASNVQLDKVADGWGEDLATTEIKRIAQVFAEIAKQYPYANFRVVHRGHYYHEYCTEFTFDSGEGYDSEDSEVDYDKFSEAEDGLTEAARDFMEWIYRRLEKGYEYQNSDEVIEENIKANEYTFTETGKRED